MRDVGRWVGREGRSDRKEASDLALFAVQWKQRHSWPKAAECLVHIADLCEAVGVSAGEGHAWESATQ